MVDACLTCGAVRSPVPMFCLGFRGLASVIPLGVSNLIRHFYHSVIRHGEEAGIEHILK